MHKDNRHMVFMVLDELTNVEPGGPSLFRCMPLHDESKLCKYLEDDLTRTTLEEARADKDIHDLGDFE